MHKPSHAISAMEAAAPRAFSTKRIRREHLRWQCLSFLDGHRPAATTDIALLSLVQAVYADATIDELRREVDYLSMRELLTITERGGIGHLKLTFQGVDVVEFTSACPPGIGRPLLPESD